MFPNLELAAAMREKERKEREAERRRDWDREKEREQRERGREEKDNKGKVAPVSHSDLVEKAKQLEMQAIKQEKLGLKKVVRNSCTRCFFSPFLFF